MPVAENVHGEGLQTGRGELVTDLLRSERGEQAVEEIPFQEWILVRRMAFDDLPGRLGGFGSAEIGYEDEGAGP
jgi:hypothetical protein